MLRKIFNIFQKQRDNQQIDSSLYQKIEKEIDVKGKTIIENKVAEEKNVEKTALTLSDEEINYFVEQEVKERVSESEPESIFNDINKRDVLFEEAARLIVVHQQGSTSLIQRKFSIGYNRTGRLMDQLEAAGIVGPAQGSKPREVYVSDEYSLEKLLSSIGGFDIKDLKKNFFNKNILPLKEAFIQEKVYQYYQKIEEEREEQLKETLRQEILEKERQRLKKNKIRNLRKQLIQEMAEEGLIKNDSIISREPIPQDVQDKVWNRDGGKCVKCGGQHNLEFDHIIHFSKGGANTYRNLQLLCESCNRQKSNNIG